MTVLKKCIYIYVFISVKRVRWECITNKQAILTNFCKTEMKSTDWWSSIEAKTTKADRDILISDNVAFKAKSVMRNK